MSFAILLVEAFRVVFSRLFLVEISQPHCVSRLGRHSLSLAQSWLGSAKELEAEFTVFWPLLRRPRKRRVRLEFTDSAVAGCAWQCEQTCRCFCTRVRMKLFGDIPAPGTYALEVRRESGGRPLGKLSLQVLDSHEARNLALEAFQVTGLRLWIQDNCRFQLGTMAADSSDFIIPEFTVPGTALCAFLPPFSATLTLSVGTAAERTEAGELAVPLSEADARVRWPAVPLQDVRLFPKPGWYTLELSLSGRSLASLRFRLMDEKEVLRAASVSGIAVDVQTREGRLVTGLRTLRWDEHKAFRPSVRLCWPLTAPKTLLPCGVRLLRNSEVLAETEFLVPQDRLFRTLRLPAVTLDCQPFRAAAQPVRFTISVELNHQHKLASAITILPPERISNFEGQLRFDASELAFDDSEYEHIVRSLGIFQEQRGNGLRQFAARLVRKVSVWGRSR